MRRTPIFLLALGLSAAAASPLKIGLAFTDPSGKNDHSFNQAAWEGATRAAHDLGVSVTAFTPDTIAHGAQGVATLLSARPDLVIGVGFASTASVNAAAKSNPATKFAVVDDLPEGQNTAGLRFREEEGSFLVGYVAGRSSSTGVVGFVGGVAGPLIKKFEVGYRAGVKAACKSCHVLFGYIGTTDAAWDNPTRAGELADVMRRKGADVIYSAAGSSGTGVIDYVRATQCLRAGELPAGVSFGSDNFKNVPKSASYTQACTGNSRPMFFIGVDSNQNYLGDFDKNPKTLNHGLTSMLKRVDNAVYALIKDVASKQAWRGGDRMFALQNQGVDYALDEYNRALIPVSLQKQLDAVKKVILNGTIKVPSQ